MMISGGAMGAGIAALAFAGSYAALIIALIVLHAVSGLYATSGSTRPQWIWRRLPGAD